jgi:amino acid transporter
MLVTAGFRLVANAGDEEAVARLKRQLIYGVMGLILLAVAEFIVQNVVFIEGGTTFDAQRGRELIVSFTNFISGFIALTSFIAFLYAGYLYVVSGSGVVEDQSEKVKKIVIGGILGILIAAGSFAIVNTVVRLDAGESPQIIQDQLDTLSR